MATKRDNIVSAPPTQTSMINQDGTPTRAWAIWFRDIFTRTSYKGGNSIDDSFEAIEGIEGGVGDNTEQININAQNIEDNRTNIIANAAAIDQNRQGIAQNVIDIEENAVNIASNATAISNNSAAIAANSSAISNNANDISNNKQDISNNKQDILNLEHRCLGDGRPLLYDESASYTIGDYVVNPNSNNQNYYIASEDIATPAGAFDPAKWFEVSLKSIREGAIASFVKAGYGSIGLNAVTALSDIAVGSWQTLDMDTTIIASPKDVTYDFTTQSMALESSGVWNSSVKISLTFDDVNNGRKLMLRYYNVTKAVAGASVFVEGVGRNVDVGGFSFSFPAEVPEADEGDKLVLQISGDSIFTNVEQIGSVWQFSHISEAKNI